MNTRAELDDFLKTNYASLQEMAEVYFGDLWVDVLHEVYESAVRKIDKGQPIRKPWGWFHQSLYTNATSKTAPFHYANEKWERSKVRVDDGESFNEGAEKLEEVMDLLDRDQRALLTLLLDGDTINKISTGTGISRRALLAIKAEAIKEIQHLL